MASNVARGKRYEKKSKDLLESEGWYVERSEIMQTVGFIKGRQIFRKHDLFGADLMAMNGERTLFVQVKLVGEGSKVTSKMWDAKKAFEKYPIPNHIERVLHIWKPRKKVEVYKLSPTSPSELVAQK